MTRLGLAIILVVLSTVAWLPAQTTEFSYDGRVRSGGVPFDGNGQFKFAIVSGDGAICYWANDGVTLTGDEPTSSVQIQVSSGFFSSIIGDETISGMAPLDPSIFNTEERVNLRVWFNDGANGFQQLTPDRPITNPALIGIQSARQLTLYVNPVTGNDRNPGSKPSKAKKTIQAAWDVIPASVAKDVVIQLASGEYYQSALLTGKTIFNNATITLNGDDHSSDSALLIGAQDRATSNTAVRLYSLKLSNQKGIRLVGLRFQNALYSGCGLFEYSFAEVIKCKLLNANRGIDAEEGSHVILRDCLISDFVNGPQMEYGLFAGNQSHGESFGCAIVHTQVNVSNGVLATHMGVVDLQDTTIDGFTYGANIMYGSILAYGRGGNIVKNCTEGTRGILNALLAAPYPASGKVTYQNVGQQVVTASGAQTGG